jgi:hypothetical protein
LAETFGRPVAAQSTFSAIFSHNRLSRRNLSNAYLSGVILRLAALVGSASGYRALGVRRRHLEILADLTTELIVDLGVAWDT